MKLLSIIALLALLPLAAAFSPQTSGGTPGGANPPVAKEFVVKPGEIHTNNDLVVVDNDRNSEGDMTITPKGGGPNSKTKVVCKKKSKGKVKGLDWNDTVDVLKDATVNISGSGGNVTVQDGGTATVENTNGPGGGNITVTAGSLTVTVLPGMTVLING